MKVFISVVSHHHGELINKLSCLNNLASRFKIVVKDNVGEKKLKDYCEKIGVIYLNYDKKRGFGENNNLIYKYCIQLGMSPQDLFIVLNPDVVVSADAIESLVNQMNSNNYSFATINLFKDTKYKVYDPCVRKYPRLTDFIMSYLGFKNNTIINKCLINEPLVVDWAAGSFLAIKAENFGKVGGFNTRYFMYCEDIDLCLRLKGNGTNLYFIPGIKAMHLAKHNNRKFFSKHFYWHLRSMIIYLLERRKYVS